MFSAQVLVSLGVCDSLKILHTKPFLALVWGAGFGFGFTTSLGLGVGLGFGAGAGCGFTVSFG